ncbi:hypothetical protein CHUAL_008262 [Chamberlinius hualienensis]
MKYYVIIAILVIMMAQVIMMESPDNMLTLHRRQTAVSDSIKPITGLLAKFDSIPGVKPIQTIITQAAAIFDQILNQFVEIISTFLKSGSTN